MPKSWHPNTQEKVYPLKLRDFILLLGPFLFCHIFFIKKMNFSILSLYYILNIFSLFVKLKFNDHFLKYQNIGDHFIKNGYILWFEYRIAVWRVMRIESYFYKIRKYIVEKYINFYILMLSTQK